jgi:uncharacterized membrane protein YdbT with pleckstrin-like domain
MRKEINTEEKTIWEGYPSQWLNLRTYAYCVIIVAFIVAVLFFTVKLRWLFALFLLYPAGRALFAWHELRSKSYKLTALRILHREGVFNRITSEIKLSEIRDVILMESLYKRIIGLGDICLNLKGFSESYVILPGIRNADKIKELINTAVKQYQTENTSN